MSMPVLKLRQVVGFPGNIVGGTGIEATKLHGTVTIDMDWNEFGLQSAIPTSPTNNILTFDTATEQYVMIPSSLLGGAVAGIADAPNDGNQYGRQSGDWTLSAWSTTGSDIYNANAGNVGIGTSTPLGRLDVKVATNQRMISTTVGGVAFLSFLNDAADAYVPATINANPLILNGYGTSGNVGVGTLSPAAKLEVAGAARFGVAQITEGSTPATIAGVGQLYVQSGQLNYKDASGTMTVLTPAGTATFIQAGTGAITRTMQDKARDIVSVKDFGAVGDGVVNDTPSFQAAIDSISSGSAISLLVPAGSYLLNTNVTNNGRIVSWHILAGATFSGAGTLPSFGTPNYLALPITSAQQAFVRGSPSTPTSIEGAITIAELHTNSTETTLPNPAAAVFAHKYMDESGTLVQGLFIESVDHAGWVGSGNNNFIEGMRCNALLLESTLGSPYAAVFTAMEDVTSTHTYMVAVEGAVLNNSAHATAIFNPSGFTASFVATSGGSKKVDAAYTINPFTAASNAYIRGFYVPQGTESLAPVYESSFRTDAACAYGLAITGATFSAVAIPNSIPITATSVAGGVDLNIMYLNNINQLVLGAGATGLVAGLLRDTGGTPITAKEFFLGAPNSGGAGFRQIVAVN